MLSAVFAATLLMAQAAPAAGSDAPKPTDASVAAAAKAPKVNKDGLVCHTEEVLGSRIPQRICFTPEEAEQRKQQDQQNLQRMQSQFSSKTPG